MFSLHVRLLRNTVKNSCIRPHCTGILQLLNLAAESATGLWHRRNANGKGNAKAPSDDSPPSYDKLPHDTAN